MGIYIKKQEFPRSLYIPVSINYIGSALTRLFGEATCPRNIILKTAIDVIPGGGGIQYLPSHPYRLQLVGNTYNITLLEDDVEFGTRHSQDFFQFNAHVFRLPYF